MNQPPRLVSNLPLERLWRDNEWLDALRARDLRADDIRDLLRLGQVQFVVADCSKPIQWIPLNDCYDFWKREVLRHLPDPATTAYLKHLPDEYCYFASEWRSSDIERLVVLEMHH